MPSTYRTAQFLLEYPSFTRMDADQVQGVLDRVERLYCPVEIWKEHQKDGVYLRAAHILTLLREEEARIAAIGVQAAKGQITPPPSRSGASDDLDSTPYGQQFKEIRDLAVGGIGVFVIH
jgi:hypothetical protein